MIRSIAEFSKVIKKYSYYPMIIGLIGLGAGVAYGGSRAVLGITVAAVCAVLCVLALCSSRLCKKAGIDDKII